MSRQLAKVRTDQVLAWCGFLLPLLILLLSLLPPWGMAGDSAASAGVVTVSVIGQGLTLDFSCSHNLPALSFWSSAKIMAPPMGSMDEEAAAAGAG